MSLETSPHVTDLFEPPPEAPKSDGVRVRAERTVRHFEHTIKTLWGFCSAVLFILYLFIELVSLWIWVLRAFIATVHLAIRSFAYVLLWLAGGVAPRHHRRPRTLTQGLRQDLQEMWNDRLIAYEEVMRPLGRHYVRTAYIVRQFWYWHLSRKLIAITFATVCIGIPALFVIPRPHYVQITDDNAIHYDHTSQVIYIVHALDLFKGGKTREYINEDAWWLGKINSQGLKAQLQIGHNYRLWIVGIRWYWKPRMFPNIISATEVDRQGRTLQQPTSHLDQPAATAR